MNIKTKYSVGEDVKYFDCTHLKLINVKVIAIGISSDIEGTSISYTLDISRICDNTCSLIDDVTVYLMKKDDEDPRFSSLVVDEKYLFSSVMEFVDHTTAQNTKVELADDVNGLINTMQIIESI